MASSVSSPPKRSVRTYGRPKAVASDEDGDALYAKADISETSTMHTTRAEDVPSSPASDTDDLEDPFAQKPRQAASGTNWGWQSKLHAIDDDNYEFNSSHVYVDDEASKANKDSATPPPQSNALTPPHPNHMSPLRHQPSQHHSHIEPSSEHSSPLPSRAGPRRRKPPRVNDSDSESTPKSGSRSSASPHKAVPPGLEDSDDELPNPSDLLLPTTASAPSVPRVPPSGSDVEDTESEISVPKPTRTQRRRSKVTKKDMHETSKARARIANEQPVGIIPTSQAKFTTSKLLERMKLQTTANMPPPPLKKEMSDVIEQFSSPALLPSAKIIRLESRPVPVVKRVELPDVNMDSDEDFPEYVPGTKKPSETTSSSKIALQKRKQALLAQTKSSTTQLDDDDDLEILPRQETKPVISKMGPNLAAQRRAPRKSIPAQQAKAKPNVRGLNSQLLSQIEKVNEQQRLEREQEYVKSGGKVSQAATSALPTPLNVYLARRQIANAQEDSAILPQSDAEGGDEDDDDYNPALRGSASPEPGSDGSHSDVDMDVDPDRTMVNSSPEKVVMGNPLDTVSEVETEEEQEDKENELKPIKRTRKHAKSAVFHSDEETENGDEDDDEKISPVPRLTSQRSFGQILASDSTAPDPVNDENADPQPGFSIHLDPRSPSSLLTSSSKVTSSPSSDSHLPSSIVAESTSRDITDKGPVRPPLNHRPDSLGGLIAGVQGRLALSPHSEDFDTENDAQRRAPALTPLGTRTLSFTERLQLSSPSSTPGPSRLSQATLQPSPMQPQFGLGDGDSFGFSQFSPSQKGKGKSLFDRKAPLDDDLLFTQEYGLKPAHEVSETQQERANEVFEKAQGHVLQDAQRDQLQKKETLYVNDLGFLTQTRPSEDAEAYCPSQMTPALTSTFSMSNRTPFAPLSVASSVATPDVFSDEEEENTEMGPPRGRLSRTRPLQRRADSPSDGRETLAPSQKPPTAFSEIMKPKVHRKKEILKSSILVHDQAVESDDDEVGFGGPNRHDADDEEDDEDPYAVVAGLLDDKEMDELEVNKEKVLEKVREDLEADAQKAEEQAKAVAFGEHRRKRNRRNGGIGIDSDDSEDEDGIHPHRLKKRKKEREDITGLALRPETQAFAAVYQNDFKPEGLDFIESAPEADVEMSPAEENYDDEENDNGNTVSVQQLNARLREVARHGDQEPGINVDDLTWLEEEANSDNDSPAVRFITTDAIGPNLNKEDFDELHLQRTNNKVDGKSDERQRSWARLENRTRHHGNTGRSNTGGSAITGHGKRPVGKPVRTQQTNAVKPKAPLKAAPSVLSGVDRSGRFS